MPHLKNLSKEGFTLVLILQKCQIDIVNINHTCEEFIKEYDDDEISVENCQTLPKEKL